MSSVSSVQGNFLTRAAQFGANGCVVVANLVKLAVASIWLGITMMLSACFERNNEFGHFHGRAVRLNGYIEEKTEALVDALANMGIQGPQRRFLARQVEADQ